MNDEKQVPKEGEVDEVAIPIPAPGFEGEEPFDMSKLSDEEYAALYEVPKESTSCWHCCDNKTCKYAWDPYNVGDCLADK